MDLLYLAHWGSLDGVQKLIEQGTSVNTTNGSNQTALYFACENGWTKLAEYLLECGASVNLGAKPLIAAVRSDHYDCVELLLKHNASLYCTNNKGESPMSVAQDKCHYSIILLLVQYGVIPSTSLTDKSLQLVKHAKVEHAGAITKLIDDNILNLTSEDVYLAVFGYSFKGGILELARRMLSDNNYTNVDQLYPVAAHYSAKYNWLAILSTLLEKHFDVNMLIEEQTALYVACREGHESVMNLLLNNGADPNIPSKTPSSKELQLPIETAVDQANPAMFTQLLAKGAKLHSLTLGEPLLHTACNQLEWKSDGIVQRSAENVMATIRLLLAHGVAVNAVSDKGDTALYRACINPQLEVVQVLLEAGANVNLTTGNLYPLVAACATGNAELINLLLNAGANVTCYNSKEESCLHVIVSTCTVDSQRASDTVFTRNVASTIKSLLQRGIHVNAQCSQQETALYRASKAGHEDIVRVLLEGGAETSGSNSRRPLYAACEHGHTEIVDLLLQHGADPNLPSVTSQTQILGAFVLAHLIRSTRTSFSLPICCAVQKGHSDLVNLLLRHGADVNKQESCGKSALIYLIEHFTSQIHHDVDPVLEKTNFDILKSLLLAGGDVNIVSESDGLSAFHIASSFGRCDIMAELIQHGVDSNLPTGGGKSAVDLACQRGHEAAVELLLKNGAKLGGKSSSSTTSSHMYYSPRTSEPALSLAAKNNNDTLVKMLLNHEADVNIKLPNGDSALHLTTSSAVVETLLKAGANVNAVNDRSETALSKVCSLSEVSLDVVEMLLTHGADPNICFPLISACKNHNASIVQLLLKYGADPNLETWHQKHVATIPAYRFPETEFSTLCNACMKGSVLIVSSLLKGGAYVRVASSDGKTPLHFAIERLGNQENVEEIDPIVTLLLEYDAPVNVLSNSGETPLYLACSKGLVNVVKQLLDRKADVDLTFIRSHKHPLLVACEGKSTDIAIMLVNRGADVNVRSNEKTPLKVAVSNGDVALVKSLIMRGADVDQINGISNTALHLAVIPPKGLKSDNCFNIVKLLLRNGAELNALNAKGETPLCVACTQAEEMNLDIIQALLEHGADPKICPFYSGESQVLSSWSYHEPVFSPLTAAVRCTNTVLITLLIEYGARLDDKDAQGKTVLHHAVGDDNMWNNRGIESRKCDTSVAEILLSAGAEVDALDSIGASPLYWACKGGKTDFVKLLLNHRANPNMETLEKEKCRYPIHAACQSQCYDAVKLLLQHDADVSARDKNGKSALQYVLDTDCHNTDYNRANDNLIQLLCDEPGTDINAASEDGETPLYVACSHGILSAVDHLLRYGARVAAKVVEKSPLSIACSNKHIPIVQLLLTSGVNPDLMEYGQDRYDFMSPLAIAATGGSGELVELLVKHGANINADDDDGNTVLHHALQSHYATSSRYGRTTNTIKKSVIEVLLENEADVNVANRSNETPLYMATSRGLPNVVEKMLESCRGDPNKFPPVKNPLIVACEKKDLQLVDSLLKHGADPNASTIDKFSLSVAVENGSDEIVLSLLKAGAMVNAVTSTDNSIVNLAVRKLTNIRYMSDSMKHKHVATLRLLMEYGAELNSLTPDGDTLLHLVVAALQGECLRHDNRKSCLIESIQLFVKHGATLLGSSSCLGENLSRSSRNVQTLQALMTFNDEHSFLMDLFQAGAEFELLTLCGSAVALDRPTTREVKSIRLCQAAVLAGYKPSAQELQELEQEVARPLDVGGLVQQLLDWLNEDRQQVPSLQRQCRIAIRRQLSTATSFRTILPAIEKLHLPSDLKLYLQFEGQRTEVDLGVRQTAASAASVEQQKHQAQLISAVLGSGERNRTHSISDFLDYFDFDEYNPYNSSDNDDYLYCYGGSYDNGYYDSD